MPAFTKILLISKKNDETSRLREDLARMPDCRVTWEETAEEAMKGLTKLDYDFVIVVFEKFGVQQVKLIRGIREVSKIEKFVILSDVIEDAASETVKDEKSLVLIDKALLNMEKDIAGLCTRLIGVGPHYQRESKRHPVNQRATILLLASNKTYNGRVINLSDKGACVEVNTSTVKKDDLVKLTIMLDELGRQRIVTAEVRWVQGYPGRAIMGVRFKKTGDEPEDEPQS